MISKLLPFIALIAAAALFFLYIRPEFSGDISQLTAQNATDDQALAAAARFKAREADLTQQRDAIPSDDIDRLEAYVPDNVDTVRVVIDLNALASRTGVALSGFVVDPSSSSNTTNASGQGLTSGSSVDSVELSLTATGTYSAFRAFLTGLESSLRPYDVTEVDVKNSATGVYTYTLTVRTYSLQ